METTTENSSPADINGPESTPDSIGGSDSPTDSRLCNHGNLLAEVESLRFSYQNLHSKSSSLEESLAHLQQEKEEAVNRNCNLEKIVEELSQERRSLLDKIGRLEESLEEKEEKFKEKSNEELEEKEKIKSEIEAFRERIDILESEKNEKNQLVSKTSDSIKSMKLCLVNIIKSLDEKAIERETNEMTEPKLDQESWAFLEEITAVTMLASKADSKVSEYKEAKKKEKKELENSVVSLTEENRDINSLLRMALVEKEAVEKSLNKLKGNNEQKRVPLLHFAERGLQRVGFGFMMGSGNNEQLQETSGANVAQGSNKSYSSESEEEVVSLASTVEKIMKNLRLEIGQLRKSLEESRSDTERLQTLTEKQAKQIEENMLYIKSLEDRERLLVQNVEELLLANKEAEEEVARWREACELEVKAGKKEIEERDKVVLILKQELERTKTALNISNGKLKLKEELASTAMAAQAAAEKSLQLADSRAAGLRNRIEQLTKQLEETENKEPKRSSLHKVRHICWPWRALKMNPAHNTNDASSQVQNIKRMLPEMQALLHYNV